MSGLCIGQTRILRKEKNVQKEASPPQKEPKKKQDAGVKLDKDGFSIYDQSLFPSFDAPEWLDTEQEWCVRPAYCTNYGGKVTPFDPK
jgi:hypothetical protein